MTETIENPGQAALLEALKNNGPEGALAMDIPRMWATGAQAFVNPQFAMIVFREQNIFTDESGETVGVALKNVASLVMPIEVAKELHNLLGQQLSAVDASK